MNRISSSSSRTESALGLSLLRAVSGCTMLAMLLLPASVEASPFSFDGSGGAVEGGEFDQGTGLSVNPNDVPFGDDTIGTLPIHCDDDAMSMDQILHTPAPVFFIEGTSSEILNLVNNAVPAPGASQAPEVYAVRGSTPGHWRVYFVGEVDLTLDRERVASSKHRVTYGLFGTQGFGRGKVAYGGPGSGWSRPSALYAMADHRIPLAELERNGLLVGAATKVMTLGANGRSTTSFQDSTSGLTVSLRP